MCIETNNNRQCPIREMEAILSTRLLLPSWCQQKELIKKEIVDCLYECFSLAVGNISKNNPHNITHIDPIFYTF